ncbi:AraC family transcriptional regulator, L-rhamnose operon transcriptional activator RhaR [Paenibacillus catalpae]|uniref:AraC family transcriptional regulator, L-rhamnose operon transcriptional activator RhaR n=1 Tax=Paenibacillus catalpae TaxID=1045775 RepID=A0A1I1U3N3_9BACL|nr:AraC family transcriptional regulator [Paenibacillus catalpae]SFD65456.1 AraC family transcriptional regulator, L-rhamnose operon transcriptional activator RhaR [Paenibacillus catalpae]
MIIELKSDQHLESKNFLFHIEPYQLNKGTMIALHRHEFVELVIINQGAGIHEYDGNAYSIAAGDVFIIEPGMDHAYSIDHREGMEVVNVLFVPSLLERELAVLSGVTSFIEFYYMEPFLRSDVSFQAKLTLSPRQLLDIRGVIDQLIKEYRRKESGYQFLIKSKLIELFIILSRMYDSNRKHSLTSIDGDQEMMGRICEFIQRHPSRPLTLEQISQMAGMSQSKFTVLFRQITGMSFVEYRNAERIQLAKQLLQATSDKIARIAMDTGYEDLSHFNHIFKKITGETPSQYRRRLRESSESSQLRE